MSEWIQKNPILLIALFVAIVVIILIIRIAVGAAGKKKKKAALLGENIAEVAFNAAIFTERNALTRAGMTGYEIFSVNGEAPRIIGHSLLVPAGNTQIDMQYMISGDSLGSKHTNVFERQQVSFDFEQGERYAVEYKVLGKEFSIKKIS